MLTFSPFNIIFLICPSQSNFILTFSPSTLRFLSVLRNGVFILPFSPSINFLSGRALAEEFQLCFQPLNITFLISPSQWNISSLLSAPQDYVSYQSLTRNFILLFIPSKQDFNSDLYVSTFPYFISFQSPVEENPTVKTCRRCKSFWLQPCMLLCTRTCAYFNAAAWILYMHILGRIVNIYVRPCLSSRLIA